MTIRGLFFHSEIFGVNTSRGIYVCTSFCTWCMFETSLISSVLVITRALCFLQQVLSIFASSQNTAVFRSLLSRCRNFSALYRAETFPRVCCYRFVYSIENPDQFEINSQLNLFKEQQVRHFTKFKKKKYKHP